MRELAPGLKMLDGRPRNAINVYLADDVLNNVNVRTGLPGLHEPLGLFTPDPLRNRVSARRLAALRPSLAVFGHGAPLRDPGKLADFADRMPRD